MEAPFRAPAHSSQLPQSITQHGTLRQASSALPLVSPVKNPSLVPRLRHSNHFCAPVYKWETLLLLLPRWEILTILSQHQGLSNEKHMFPAHSSLILVFPIAFPHTKKPKTWKMLLLVTARSNPTTASPFCRCLCVHLIESMPDLMTLPGLAVFPVTLVTLLLRQLSCRPHPAFLRRRLVLFFGLCL